MPPIPIRVSTENQYPRTKPSAAGTPCGACGQRSTVLMPRRNLWTCPDCYLADPATIHEIAARTKRVRALTEVLIGLRGNADAARAMSPAEWEMVALGAGLKTAPSLETREIVLHALEDYARRSTDAVR